jgi:hypothetical protein
MRKHHKEDSSSWEISLKKSSVKGIIPKDSSIRRRHHKWKDTFSINDNGGEIYQMQDRNARRKST